MSQLLKRTVYVVLLTLFCMGSTVLVITTYFADNIERSIVSKIQQNMQTPLILNEVEFTLYDNFPHASVKITDLLILESQKFDGDTLIFAKRAYVNVSLLNIIRKNYTLKTITINDAKINIKYNESNLPNFLVFKKPKNNKSSVKIEKVVLIKTKLCVKKEAPIVGLSWSLENLIVSISNNNYIFNSNGFSKNLIVANTDYLNNKQLNFRAETQITKDTINILKSNLNINDVQINLTGSIIESELLDLEITALDQEINQLILQMPKKIQNICSTFFVNGKINFKSTLQGLMNKEKNPHFKMEYQIAEGDFKLKSNAKFKLTDINCSGNLSNGKNRNFNSTKISSTIFNAKTKNGTINGMFTIKNINHLFLDADFQSSWDLSALNMIFKKSPFKKLQGKLFNSTKYNGNIIFNSDFKTLFLNANHSSDIKFENLSFNYKNSPLKYDFQTIDCKINNHNIDFEKCLGTISETDFDFNGKTKDFIAYIIGSADKFYLEGDIKSTYTNFVEVLSIGNTSNEVTKNNTSIMPDWVEASCNVDIKNFSYDNFIASDISGLLKYRDQEIKSSNLEATSLNGEIASEFSLIENTNNNLKLISNISLKNINIRNSFDAFNNYGQTFIQKEQLKGVGSAKINIESHWGPNFVLDDKKLKIQSHLIIEKGEVIEFKPLEKLSTYISLDELKHVKFSTLENTINVENRLITIPTMEIKSSALSVMLSGTHTFDQEINYEITLLLSEILSSSFRKKNTEITKFGEKQQDGKIFNTIYFKMTGNTEDPKISLNKIRFMEDINKTIQKEKTILSDILKEDILQNQEKKNVEEGKKIEIEWEPNF